MTSMPHTSTTPGRAAAEAPLRDVFTKLRKEGCDPKTISAALVYLANEVRHEDR